MRNLLFIIVFSISSLIPFAAQTQQISQYDRKMLRLAEILGSLHYLRNLCDKPTMQWRDRMNEITTSEKQDPLRKTRLYAAFNDAYRAFSENYHSCTPAAAQADQNYLAEGKILSNELLSNFSN